MHTHTHTHTHKQTHTHTHTKLQNHIRILVLPFCTHHDPKYITESLIDDYNKTDARSVYKHNTQYLILHLKVIARVTKIIKIPYSNKGF